MNHVLGQIFFLQKDGLRHFSSAFLCLFGLLLILPTQWLAAQNVNSLRKEGDGHFQKEQYYQAAQYYQVAVGLTPDDAEMNYHLAESYREIFNYPLAANYYQRTLQLDPYSYPLAEFYLARMNKATGQFNLAKDQFDSFVRKNQSSQILDEPQRSKFIAQARIESDGCEWAQQQLASPFNEQGFVNLPSPVNSAYNDYAVDVLQHDSTLTITSGRRGAKGSLIDNRYGDYFTDIINLIKTSKWQRDDLSNRFETVNTKFNDGAGCYNTARDAYYFTSCYEGNAFCRLYVTNFKNNRWTRPRPLGEEINLTGYDNRHPALSPSGDTLYFTSNRPGGFGGNDIWMSISDGSEGWQSPTLVPNINTAFNEVAPYLHSDGTLFFSSDGWVGFGGLDIFSLSPLDDQPRNLGVPINSGFDDSFFTLGDKLGYLSSNRTGGQGKFDIYQFPWPGDPQTLIAQFKGRAEGERLTSRIRQYGSRTLVASRDEDQFYYDNLTAEERAQLDRIIAARRISGTNFNPSNLGPDDFKYYQKLDIETKAIIERLAQRELILEANEANNDQKRLDILQPRDLEYYEGVSSEERAIIDRIISAKVEDRQEAIAALPPAERDYWQNSPLQSQERIENLALDQSLSGKQQQLTSNRLKLSQRVTQNQAILDQNNFQAIDQIEILSADLASGYDQSISRLQPAQQLFYQQLDDSQKDDLHKLALRKYIEQSDLSPQTQRNLISQLALPEYAEVMNNWSPEDQTAVSAVVDGLAGTIMNQSDTLHPRLAATFDQMSIEERLVAELQAQQSLLMDEDQQAYQQLQEIAELRSDLQSETQVEGLSDQEQQMEQQLAQRLAAQDETFAIRKLQPRDAYFFKSLSPLQNHQIQKLSEAVYHARDPINIDDNLTNSFTSVDETYFKSLPPSEQQILAKLVTEGLKTGDESAERYLDLLDSVDLVRVQRLRTQYLQANTPDESQPTVDSWDSTELEGLSPASVAFIESQPQEYQASLKSIVSKGFSNPQILSQDEQHYLETLTPQEKEQLAKVVSEHQSAQDSLTDAGNTSDTPLITDSPDTHQLPQDIEPIDGDSPELTGLSPASVTFIQNQPREYQTSLRSILSKGLTNLQNLTPQEQQYLDTLTPQQREQLDRALVELDSKADTGITDTAAVSDSLNDIEGHLPVHVPSQLEADMIDWHQQLSPVQQKQLIQWGDDKVPLTTEIVQKSTLDFNEYQGETLQFLQSRSLEELRALQSMMDVFTETHPEKVPVRFQEGPTLLQAQLLDGTHRAWAGQTVNLIDEQGQVVATTTTDSQGRFSFYLDDYQSALTIKPAQGLPFTTKNWQIEITDPRDTATDSLTTVNDLQTEPLEQVAAQTPTTEGPNAQGSDTARVYFDFDRFQLRPEAKKTIESVADFLKAYSQAEVVVGGHTDYIGSSQYNQRLSERRSNAAATYLQQLAPQVKTRIVGFGETQPRFSNRTAFGRQYNRRVELMVNAPIAYRAAMRTVLVKPGVSLSTLATNLGLSEDLILSWNGLVNGKLRAYQPLRLPVTIDFEQYHRLVFDPKSKSDDYELAQYHLVQRGDTFSALAIQYDTTVQRLEELNKIRARDLKAGTRIRVR